MNASAPAPAAAAAASEPIAGKDPLSGSRDDEEHEEEEEDGAADDDMAEEEVAADGPYQLDVTNWGAFGPEGAGAAGPNVLHAHNPGGPNWPGIGAANPTLIQSGNQMRTWVQLLETINVKLGGAAGAVGGALSASNHIQFVSGDPTRLLVPNAATRDTMAVVLTVCMGHGFTMTSVKTTGVWNTHQGR